MILGIYRAIMFFTICLNYHNLLKMGKCVSHYSHSSFFIATNFKIWVYIKKYVNKKTHSSMFNVQFQTSKMLGKWSPTFNLLDIKLSHIPDDRYIFSTCTRTFLSVITFFLIFFKSFHLFVMIGFWVLDIMTTLPI